ncbi:MAG: 8-oxo-dGTP diphosphatase [Oscillospiraceae bacterium]|nr:8-oxo-dGTP diphosphatase [Oscillospiraceae bacterium]
MARTEQAIFTVLVMVSDPEGRILVQDRLDPSWPGICFPGGHVEPGEAFTTAAIRETLEETGLTIEDPRLCGVKQFQTRENARYVVFFYKATQYTGELRSSEEGEVFWIRREELANYTTVEDFSDMLRVFDEDDLNEFYYYTENGQWQLKLL